MVVGRTPRSAAGPLAGFRRAQSGSRGTRADLGVRPTPGPENGRFPIIRNSKSLFYQSLTNSFLEGGPAKSPPGAAHV